MVTEKDFEAVVESVEGTGGYEVFRQSTERRLLVLIGIQFAATILIGGFIILSVVQLGSGQDQAIRTAVVDTLINWGGVVMGFLFGSMFTQMSTIIEAFRHDGGRR